MKYNKKKEQTYRYKDKLVVTSGEGRGTIGVGKWRFKLLGIKYAQVCTTTWGIQLIMCNNYKLKITIKIV